MKPDHLIYAAEQVSSFRVVEVKSFPRALVPISCDQRIQQPILERAVNDGSSVHVAEGTLSLRYSRSGFWRCAIKSLPDLFVFGHRLPQSYEFTQILIRSCYLRAIVSRQHAALGQQIFQNSDPLFVIIDNLVVVQTCSRAICCSL